MMEVCPRCAEAESMEASLSPDGVTMLTCSNTAHAPYSWAKYVEPVDIAGREGLGEELGIYEDLPATLDRSDPWVEYGIIEHRYALAQPTEYRSLVERYGHTALAPSKYTASAFLARALGQLAREGVLVFRSVPATGRWKYNGQISGWCLPGAPAEGSDEVLSWEQFATLNGMDPESWPALGSRRA